MSHPSSQITVTAGVLNLLAPGAGLTLIGALGWGIALAILFGISANAAIASTWLFPDEVPPAWAAAFFGLAAASYVTAQIRLGQILRGRRLASGRARRRARLAEVQDHLAGGAAEKAWESLQPLQAQAPDDLLVALLAAEIQTIRGDAEAAERAWNRLATLDRHHLYREQVRAGRERLRNSSPPE